MKFKLPASLPVFSSQVRLNIVVWFVVIMFMLAMMACRGGSYSEQLLSIDSLLQTDPDSAYNKLCDFDTAKLHAESDRHLYTLLMAEARDKTFHDDTVGQPLREAADYFIGHGDRRNAMRSLFYKGRGYQNAGNHGPAIISFLRSIELADTAEHLYLGKINCAISESYQAVSDAPQELEYARRSLEEYQKLDSLVFIEDMKLACGYALCRNGRSDEGVKLMQDVYSNAKARSDVVRTESALINMALGYLWEGTNVKAKDCMSVLFSRCKDPHALYKDYGYLYLDAMISAKSPPDSINLLARFIASGDSGQTLPFRYYAHNKEYNKAYEALLEEVHDEEFVFIENLHNNINYDIKNYMDAEQKTASLRITYLNNIITWIIISVVLLVCVIVILVWVYFVSKRKKEMELLYSLELLTNEKADIVTRLNKLAFVNKNLAEENSILKNEYDANRNKTQNPNSVSIHYKSDLLSKLLSEIDSLHAEYYLHGNTEKGKSILLKHLSNQLLLLREDKDILKNMEAYINDISDGLLNEVYGFIKLNADQRRIVALLSVGFSKEAVCQIMNIELSSFYTRMNRLTKRIDGCVSLRKNEFLTIIGRGKD